MRSWIFRRQLLRWFTALTIPVMAMFPLSAQSTGYSLRFFGNGSFALGLDRVAISIDAPHRPVDVGTGDFTIEWWMRAFLADNGTGPCEQRGDNWIYGNILIDRDVFGRGDHGDWGISLLDGVIAFGVDNGANRAGLCGSTMVADGAWHHVAVTRRASDGQLALYVDGTLDRELSTGPTGDLSYRDGRPTSRPWDPFLVLGAEKHSGDFAYNGWLDELRVSTVVRYAGNFSPPSSPFITDADTAALYHFDEGSGIVVADVSGAAGGPSDGELRVGGDPEGPVWSTETPFSAGPGFIFGDDFESGDLSAWSSVVGGGLTVVQPGLWGTANALAVDLGVAGRRSFVKSRHPRRERAIAVDVLLRVNRVEIGSRPLEFLRLGAPRPHVKLELEQADRGYWISLHARENQGRFRLVGRTRILPNREIHLAVEWRQATTTAAKDGVVRLLKNGRRRAEATDLENGKLVVAQVRLGAVRNPPSGARSGEVILDEYVSRRWIS